MNDEIAAALLAVAVGVGGLLRLLIPHLASTLEAKRLERKRSAVLFHISGLKKHAAIFRRLKEIVEACHCNRAVVVRSRDNGGVPRPESVIKVGIIHECYATLGDAGADKWDERVADGHYRTLLADVATNAEVQLVTSELPEGSDLRIMYDAAGTARSAVYRLLTTPEEMFYLSVNFTDEVPLTPEQQNVLRRNVSNLREIFHQS